MQPHAFRASAMNTRRAAPRSFENKWDAGFSGASFDKATAPLGGVYRRRHRLRDRNQRLIMIRLSTHQGPATRLLPRPRVQPKTAPRPKELHGAPQAEDRKSIGFSNDDHGNIQL